MDAGGSAGTRNYGILNTLTSLATPVELDGIIAPVNEKYVTKFDKLKRF